MKVLLVAVVSLVMLLAVAEVGIAGDGACDGTQVQQRDRDCQCDCDYPCDDDGDGICDNCGGCLPQGPDADGDGIPNGQDPDYVPPQDGDGQQEGR
jgi:hypothetical protein